MAESVDCERCGAALSYGEVFRHRIALDVATGRIEAKRILGDRLSPRKPHTMCAPCRSEAERDLGPDPVGCSNASWMLPVVAACAGVLVATLLIGARRGRA